ncbi:response regulator [Paenibacillus sp. JDR-2]|uniref:response regulator n=1 Tax=Paenibacillus sp. (strain JDR-2) TaxID=324057 RepID=UPI000166A37C|nr:response regulator [Paenibacillus sp. JDR-2]ACT00722.1 two component transcriptional regulator, AraC family [Paenibacillus sp. JDR-2]
MYRVMIVEDEFIVRYGIRSMIDWEKVGLEVTGEAANGKEALELIRRDPPDILITDIKMPVMDGIQLIEEVRSSGFTMKVIILSNLEEFQYAQKAIRYGVSEYMIKSDMMPRDFEKALMNVKASLDTAESDPGINVKASIVEPARKEKLLLGLIEGSRPEEVEAGSIPEEAELNGLHLPAYLLYTLIHTRDCGLFEKQQVIHETFEQIGSDRSFVVFADKQGEINVLLPVPHHEAAEAGGIKQLAERIISHLSQAYGLVCTIGLSGKVGEWTELSKAYDEALAAAKQSMFAGIGKAISYSELAGVREADGPPIKVSQSHIHTLLYGLQSKELHDYMGSLFDQLGKRQDPDLVQLISLELIMILTAIWPDVSHDQQHVVHLKKQYFDQLSKLETIEQSRRWFLQAFAELLEHMIRIYNSDRNSIIKATQFIQQHYQQEISLQSISHFVHLSKNYFANLFKKEVGESFLEYVTRVRIEKAKALLAGEMKAVDVGQMVGIQDPKYFSKVFKKITGATPSEYRSLVKENKGIKDSSETGQ